MSDRTVVLQALFDTGANATFLSYDAYRTLDPHGQSTLTPSSCGTVRVADNATTMPVQGTVPINFALTDDKGCKLQFETVAIVICNLQHPMYLGNVMLQSEHFHVHRVDGLLFHASATNSKSCDKGHFVPFQTTANANSLSAEAKAEKDYHLAPGQVCRIPFHLSKRIPDGSDFVLEDSCIAELEIVPQMHNVATSNFTVIARNTCPHEIQIDQDSTLCMVNPVESSELDAHLSLLQVPSSTDDGIYSAYWPVYQANHVAVREPPKLAGELITQGCCQVPISTITDRLDESGALTLRKYAKRATAAEICSKLQTDHLSFEYRAIVHRLVTQYRDCFAADMYELSATDLVHLDFTPRPNVQLSDLHVQYKQIPESDKPEARQILKQMLDAGIISPLRQNVSIISNLLTRRKKSGKLRIILDNRMANAYSVKIPDLGSHPLLVTTTALKDARLVTTTDFSNSFFQVPTTAGLAGICAFRGPDRELYQMNRAPQGYINSAPALNIAVYLMTTVPVTSGELSGIIPREFFNLKPITPSDMEQLCQELPHVHIGNASDTTTYSTGRPVSKFRPSELAEQKLVVDPPKGGTINYMDDMIVHTTSHDLDVGPTPSVQPLITDVMRTIKDSKPLASAEATHHPMTTRSGLTVQTRQCRNCEELVTSPPSRRTFMIHMAKLEVLFIQLLKTRMTVSPEKTIIATTRIEFLGLIWRPNQISVPATRLAAFDQLQIHSKKTLKSAIGSIAYHRMQIPAFSHLAQPLYELLNSPRTFKWLPCHIEAWRSLRRQLRIHATLHTFDPDKPLRLSTDASYHAASANLLQKCSGASFLIRAASRSFQKQELARSIIQKEVDSVTYAVKTFEGYLRGATDVTLEIDSRAVLFVAWCRDSTPFFTRLSGLLSELGITKIIHCPSQFHEPADSLSRDTATKVKFQNLADHFPVKPATAEQILRLLDIPKGTIFSVQDPKTFTPYTDVLQKIQDALEAEQPATSGTSRVIKTDAPTKMSKVSVRKIKAPFTMPTKAVTVDGPFMLSKRAKLGLTSSRQRLRQSASAISKTIPK